MPFPFPVLYEDKSLLAIDKPPLYHCIEQEGSSAPCIASELILWNPALGDVSTTPKESGLVHRLDYSTSGVLLIAKSRDAWTNLREQFSFGGIQKEYLALCEGRFEDEMRLENFIGSPYRRGKKVRVYPREESRTQRAVSTFSANTYFAQEDCSLLRVAIETGVRHQIRAHTAHLKHPLIGDEVYGAKILGETAEKLFRKLLGETRKRDFFLHACRLTITHPTNHTLLSLESSLSFSLPFG